MTETSAEGAEIPRVFVNKTHEVWFTILDNPNVSETELNAHLSHMSAGTIGASTKTLFDHGHITRKGSGHYNQRKRELYRFTANPDRPYEPSYGTRPFVDENMRGATSTRTALRRPGNIVYLNLEIGNRAARISLGEARRLYHELKQLFETDHSQQVGPR